LETRFGIHDTCGVNNLHGMPSFFGACIAMIAAYMATVEDYGAVGLNKQFPGRCTDATPANPVCTQGWSAYEQATQQLAYTATTVAIALAGGLICGFIVNQKGFGNDFKEPSDMFRDDRYWETPSQEHPYYFDFRGEIKRKEDAVAVAVREESEELAKNRDRLEHMEAALKSLQAKSKQGALVGHPPPGYAPPPMFPRVPSSSNVDAEMISLKIMMAKILQNLDRQ